MIILSSSINLFSVPSLTLTLKIMNVSVTEFQFCGYQASNAVVLCSQINPWLLKVGLPTTKLAINQAIRVLKSLIKNIKCLLKKQYDINLTLI